MKKMPHTLYLSIFLLVVGLIAGGILSGVNALTAPVIEQNQLKVYIDIYDELNVTDLTNNDATPIDGVEKIFNGKYQGKDVICVIANNTNKYTTVTVITAIYKENGTLANAKITGKPSITTHNFDANFTSDKLGLNGIASGDGINSISGATISSKSVKEALNLAFEQFKAVAGNVEKPATAKFLGSTQDYSTDAFNAFTAKVEVESKDFTKQEVSIKYTVDFDSNEITFVSSSVELSEELKTLAVSKIKLPTNYIKSLENDVYTVITKQNFGVIFTTTFKLVENKVSEYHTEYTPVFTTDESKPSASKIEGFLNGFNGKTLDEASKVAGISGVTYSCNAVKEAFNLVNAYLLAKGGAN